MSIKVIGAGFGRTGTLSLKSALEELGLVKCYHMMDVLAHLKQAAVWDDAARGKPVDWDALFRGYQAIVDWPGSAFYEQLLRQYPGAKVILTVRDPDRWYESSRQTIYLARQLFPRWLRWLNPQMERFRIMLDRVVWHGTFQDRFEDKPYAIDVFNQHIDRVQMSVPQGQLLVYDVREGWGPLCKFLELPIPVGKPFPHLNDAAEFQARIKRIALIFRMIGYGAMALVGLILVALVFIIMKR
jgi:Sulfotransferase domain